MTVKTHMIVVLTDPEENTQTSDRATICGRKGTLGDFWWSTYRGGHDEMTVNAGEARIDITDDPEAVDCARCLAAMKRCPRE